MFRLLIIAVLFYLIIYLVRGMAAGKRPPEAQAQELVRDAVSGVYFPKGEGVSITREGETFYFSTVENRDRFLAGRK